jgi:transcriptional antiterminator NusG
LIGGFRKGRESVDDSHVLALGFRVSNSTNNTTESLPSAPQWYILKVAFNREDSIREALEKRIKLSNLKEYFGEILVPTEDVVEFTRAGKKRIVKRKLYPGYLMIQMIISDDTWFLVRETPGIGDFTGTYGKPTPMTDADVERIIKLVHPDVDQEQAPKTSIPFRPGDRVAVVQTQVEHWVMGPVVRFAFVVRNPSITGFVGYGQASSRKSGISSAGRQGDAGTTGRYVPW